MLAVYEKIDDFSLKFPNLGALMIQAEQNNSTGQNFIALIARVALSLIFILSGISKIADHAGTIAMINAAGLPFPELALLGGAAVELGCGATLIAGYRARLSAAILATYTIATAIFFHRNMADPNQMIHFLKNISMMGGLLQIVAFGPGQISIGGKVSQKS